MAALQEALRKYALTFPEAHEDHPWDHIAIKVRNKTFVFLGGHKDSSNMFSMTVKLPISSGMALTLPYVEPAGYGLSRTGWVTVKCAPKDKPDKKTFQAWIEQSYRAVAPKTLSKALDNQ